MAATLDYISPAALDDKVEFQSRMLMRMAMMGQLTNKGNVTIAGLGKFHIFLHDT